MLWDMDMWREMDRLRRDMDGLFGNYGRVTGATTYPLINVYDDKDTMTVTAELPGMKKEQVNITYSDGVLTIAGKTEPLARVKRMTVVRQERAEGDFEKSVRIPTKIQQDKINASFSNGVLTIELPKAEEAKPKTIAIEAK
ncbi:MAG: Hsp20/alpha crystallin family protein [Candidatus Latescibacteria bacterium]|nr:Hsp20/alpha crystallin family protein [Candidatus Latescibacterota bacterium]